MSSFGTGGVQPPTQTNQLKPEDLLFNWTEWKGAPEWWKTIDQQFDRQFLPQFDRQFLPQSEPIPQTPEIPMAPPTNRRRIKLRD